MRVWRGNFLSFDDSLCIRFFPLRAPLCIRILPLWAFDLSLFMRVWLEFFYESLCIRFFPFTTYLLLLVGWKFFASGGEARLNLKVEWEKCPSSKAWTNLWTKAKSQKIVTQGYSALYNTPFSFKSSAWDLSPVAIEFGMCSERQVFLPPRRIETHGPQGAYSCSPNAKPKVFIVAF